MFQELSSNRLPYLGFRKEQSIEKDENGKMYVERCSPLSEDWHWNILNVPGGDEQAGVHGSEAGGPYHHADGISGISIISSNIHLLAPLQSTILCDSHTNMMWYVLDLDKRTCIM